MQQALFWQLFTYSLGLRSRRNTVLHAMGAPKSVSVHLVADVCFISSLGPLQTKLQRQFLCKSLHE